MSTLFNVAMLLNFIISGAIGCRIGEFDYLTKCSKDSLIKDNTTVCLGWKEIDETTADKTDDSLGTKIIAPGERDKDFNYGCFEKQDCQITLMLSFLPETKEVFIAFSSIIYGDYTRRSFLLQLSRRYVIEESFEDLINRDTLQIILPSSPSEVNNTQLSFGSSHNHNLCPTVDHCIKDVDCVRTETKSQTTKIQVAFRLSGYKWPTNSEYDLMKDPVYIRLFEVKDAHIEKGLSTVPLKLILFHGLVPKVIKDDVQDQSKKLLIRKTVVVLLIIFFATIAIYLIIASICRLIRLKRIFDPSYDWDEEGDLRSEISDEDSDEDEEEEYLRSEIVTNDPDIDMIKNIRRTSGIQSSRLSDWTITSNPFLEEDTKPIS